MHLADAPWEEPSATADPRRFAGQAALVTHADQPVGGAIARRLAAEGAVVSSYGPTLIDALPDPEAGRRLVAQALETTGGRLDVVVVGAAWDAAASFEAETLAGWRGVIEPNLRAAFLLCQAAAGALSDDGGGAIVTFAEIPATGVAGDAAAGGLVSLTRSLAVELGPDVRANAVRFSPLDGRPRAGEGVAAAVAFLASADAAYTTGQTLRLDEPGLAAAPGAGAARIGSAA